MLRVPCFLANIGVICRRSPFRGPAWGYTATRHQREVGTGYFDAVTVAVTGGAASTTTMGASTETAQFKKPAAEAAE
jgi:isocitrate lyase